VRAGDVEVQVLVELGDDLADTRQTLLFVSMPMPVMAGMGLGRDAIDTSAGK
jgi:hypothetical protein